MNISSYIFNRGKRASTKGHAVAACRLLANVTRFQILSALIAAQRAGNELCVSEIASAVSASQSATSHQLALLEAHGVVMKKRMGQTVCYNLASSLISKDIESIIRTFNA